jgi:two-component system cell cycle response regulator DivK
VSNHQEAQIHTILVVEDTLDTRQLIRLLLEFKGYRVLEAENGLDGVEMARRERPDAILMDMSLPVMNGCEATRLIREELGLTTVPIIACTAHNRWEWRGKAILAGCTDFITKPIDSEGLLAMLARYLRHSSSAQQ